MYINDVEYFCSKEEILAKQATVRAEIRLDVLLEVDELGDEENIGAEDDNQHTNTMVKMMFKFVDGGWNKYIILLGNGYCQYRFHLYHQMILGTGLWRPRYQTSC